MRRRVLKGVLAAAMAVAVSLTAVPAVPAQARKEMKVAGVPFDISRGEWLMFHTYLPAYEDGQFKVYDQKLQMRLNKYKDEIVDGQEVQYLNGDSEPVRRITATFQVTIPTRSANIIASGIKKKDYFDYGDRAENVLNYLNTLSVSNAVEDDSMPSAYDNKEFILRSNPYELANFFEIVVTDYKTGENLLTDDTSSYYPDKTQTEGSWQGGNYQNDQDVNNKVTGAGYDGGNYQYVQAHLTQRWQPTGVARKMETSSGLFTYYEEYFAVVEVTAPVSYDRISIGIAGISKKAVKRLSTYSLWGTTTIPSYIYVFNESFYEGYATFLNSAYWTSGDKKLSHFLRADKRIVPATTR